MVDTGASLTMVMEAWAKVHGLKVVPSTSEVHVMAASGAWCSIVGKVDMVLQMGSVRSYT